MNVIFPSTNCKMISNKMSDGVKMSRYNDTAVTNLLPTYLDRNQKNNNQGSGKVVNTGTSLLAFWNLEYPYCSKYPGKVIKLHNVSIPNKIFMHSWLQTNPVTN